MSSFLTIPNFRLISEHYDFGSFSLSHRGCYDLGALDSRVAYQRMLIIADKQYLAQFNHITFGYVQVVNFYDLLGSNLILLAPCLNNSVNLLTSFLPNVILTTATEAQSHLLSPSLCLELQLGITRLVPLRD